MMLSKEQLRRLGQLHKELSDIYLEASNEETDNKVVDFPVINKEETTSTKIIEKEEKAVSQEGEQVKEDINLESMTYNELKRLAKELNLSAKGTKAELIIRIQEAQGIVVEDEDEEETVVEEPTTEEDTEETVEDEVEEEDESEEEDLTTLHDDVMEQLEDYTDEELREILESIDKPTKGKRQTLIALIVQAIEEGLIDFGDEEEEESDDEEQSMEQDNESRETEEEQGVEDEEEEDTEDDEEEEEIDIEEILNPLDRDEVKAICRKLEIKVLKKDTAESLKEKVMDFEDNEALLNVLMDLGLVSLVDDEDIEEDEEDEEDVEVLEPNYTGSKKRIKAMKKVYAETLEDIEEGTIKPKAVTKFVKEYHNDNWTGTQEETNLEYARIKAELVDDDGDQMDLAEAYYVGDDVYCCGTELKVVDEDFYCEHCGTTYANDEE